MAKQRDQAGKDVQQVRKLKDRDGKVLMSEGMIKDGKSTLRG